MSLEPPTEETLAAIRAACEVDEETLKSAVTTIREWLQQRPHVAPCFDDKTLELLYLKCKKRIQKVYAVLNAYYSMKNTFPEILSNRDPCSTWFEEITDTAYFFPLPRLTDDLCRVFVSGLLDTDLSKFKVHDTLKVDTMVLDLAFPEEFSPFDVQVIDMTGVSARHIIQYTLPVLRSLRAVVLERIPTRLSSVHLINARAYVSVLMNLVKLVLKPKLFKKIYVHIGGLGTLHEHVPPRFLPDEYGGHAGSIQTMWDEWKLQIVKHREKFVQEDKI